MKKIILSLVCLSIGLFAADTTPQFYVSLNHGVVNCMVDGYFDGSEDLSTVVGDGGLRDEIEIGGGCQ